MNSKLIKGSLAGVAALALAAGGVTYSAWSDFSNVTGNDAGAGILKLDVGPNQGDSLLFDNVKMAPGGINSERHVYIASNSGDSTPSAQLYVQLQHVVGHEDGCDSNGESADDPNCSNTAGSGQFLTDSIMQFTSYQVNSPGQCNSSYAPAAKDITAQWGGSLANLATQAPHELTGDRSTQGGAYQPYLAPGQGICVSMALSLAYAVNNASQGDSATWDTHFDLLQAPYGTPTTPPVAP